LQATNLPPLFPRDNNLLPRRLLLRPYALLLVDVAGTGGKHLYFYSPIYERISAGEETVKIGIVYSNWESLCILCDIAYLTGININLMKIQIYFFGSRLSYIIRNYKITGQRWRS
jgi:hypothetical protein